MLRKFIITVICCMSILLLCVVTSYAQSFHTTDSTRSFDSDNLNFSKTPTLLSFDELSSLCVQVNADLSNDKFSSHLRGYSCSVGMFSLGSVSYYGIRLVYNGQALWYRNVNGGLFYALDNTDSLLSSISRVTSSISSTLTTKLTTLTNGVASIYTKLSSIDETVLIGTGTLNNIYNYLTGDLTTYLQSIDSSAGDSATFLGQISTKMDSVVNTLTTENGKSSLFYPITQRLDTIISRIVLAYSHPFAHRGWCLSGNDLSSLSVSDVGYNALSSMMETVTEEYLSYDFFAGSYYIDVLDSLDIVHATVGGNTGYFIRGTGTLSKSVNGINEFYENQTFYLGESNNTLFYASDGSRGSTGTFDVSPIVDAIETLNDNVSLISTFSRQGSQSFYLLDQPQQDSYSCTYYFSFPFNVSGFKLVLTSPIPDTSELGIQFGNYSAYLHNSDFTASGSQYVFEHMFSASELSHIIDPYLVPAVSSDYIQGTGSITFFRNDASYNAFGLACNDLYSSLRIGYSEQYYSSSYTWFSWFIEYTRNFGDFLANKLDFTGVTSRLDAIFAQLQTSGGSSSCDHTYSQEMQQSPTCALPGLMVSTCSQCGSSYSEIVSALGHDWKCTDHVEDVTDPETGEVTESGYDIYECSRCEDTYRDYSGDGVPADYGDTSISKVIVKLFSKLGTFAGKILSWIIGLFDKMLSGLDDIITRFSELTAQITGFGGDYPTWLSGFWGILPQELQLALTFAFVCIFIGLIGRKLFFA